MKINLAWIPNTLTLGNLLLGFISVIYSSMNPGMNPQSFFKAGLLILGAAILDGLDGKVARLMNVTSPLGADLDSLADCVTFGVAPGYLAYKAYLNGITILFFGLPVDLGIFIASVFPLCAAYRLARFNVSHDTDSFSGLPSPVAGIIVALVPVCFGMNCVFRHGWPKVIFSVCFVIIALLMVSTVRYSKPQETITITKIKIAFFIIFMGILIFLFRQWAVFIIIALYILSGLISFVIQFMQDHKY